MKEVGLDLMCHRCGKKIKNKLDSHISDENYNLLRIGGPAIVYCSEKCFDDGELFDDEIEKAIHSDMG